MGKKKRKKKKQSKKKSSRHNLIGRRIYMPPEIKILVSDNERGPRSQFTDSMTADDLLQHYDKILKGYSPMGNNAQPKFAPGLAAIDLARERRHDNPIPKPKPINMIVTPPSDNIRKKLSFDGGRKSKRRRKKKRRRTIKKRKKREKKALKK